MPGFFFILWTRLLVNYLTSVASHTFTAGSDAACSALFQPYK